MLEEVGNKPPFLTMESYQQLMQPLPPTIVCILTCRCGLLASGGRGKKQRLN